MSEECLSGKLICGLKTFLAVHRNSFKRDRQTPIVLIVHKVAQERSDLMFFHIKELQYHAKPEKPDPLFAKKLQEILGGQFGKYQ